MKIGKEHFLIQVKYSDLLSDTDLLSYTDSIEKYFFGFGGELYLSAEEISRYDPRIIDSIKSFVKKNNLSLRLHAPISEIDYSKPRQTISGMKSLYSKVFTLCEILKINSVVTHAEFNYGINLPIDKQFEGALSLWGALCDECGTHNIHINIENHCENKPDHLILLMKKINSPYLGMCVDLGHSNAFSDLGINEWLEKFPAGSIKEVHLADNKGNGDTHLPVGDGSVDFALLFKIFAGRDEECVFVLEPRTLSEAQKSISFLRKAHFLE